MPIRGVSRSRRVPYFLSLLLSVAACADEGAGPSHDEPEDLGGNIGLLPLTTECSYNTLTREMLVTVQSGEQAVLIKRASDSVVLVNNVSCHDAKTTTIKRIRVVENTSAPGNEIVTIDFTAGSFAPGDQTGAGITMDLGSGDDQLLVRTTASNDSVTVGTQGIALDKDNYKDVTVTNSGTIAYQFSLGAGDDIFSADGTASGTGSAMTLPVSVTGGAGNDKLTGGAGNDKLFGGDGNDTIKGGLGDDICTGDAGNDTFDESRPTSGTNGNDVYSDSAGTADKVDYSTRTSALAIDIEPAGSGTNDDGEVALGEADQLDTGIDILTGGSGDDILTGDANANTISGGVGNDTLTGGGGIDILNGEAGNDTFKEGDSTSANGGDTFNGGAGIDTIDYTGRTVGVTLTLNGLKADDGETGANEADFIKGDVENCIGGGGNDDITGSAGDNVISGGLGDDTLRGDDGNDTFDEGDSANGGDTFIGGNGFDVLTYAARTNPLTITMDGVNSDDGESGERDNVKSGIESLLGGTVGDNITGGPLDELIDSGDGDDTVHGGAGNDVILGSTGDDHLYGDADEDTLDGGDGTDALDGGDGSADICFEGESMNQCEI